MDFGHGYLQGGLGKPARRFGKLLFLVDFCYRYPIAFGHLGQKLFLGLLIVEHHPALVLDGDSRAFPEFVLCLDHDTAREVFIIRIELFQKPSRHQQVNVPFILGQVSGDYFGRNDAVMGLGSLLFGIPGRGLDGKVGLRRPLDILSPEALDDTRGILEHLVWQVAAFGAHIGEGLMPFIQALTKLERLFRRIAELILGLFLQIGKQKRQRGGTVFSTSFLSTTTPSLPVTFRLI